jgi:hypothetical protein
MAARNGETEMSNYAGCLAVLDAVERWRTTKEEAARVNHA